jgi:Pentapeptide repeats (8 copies)
VELRTISKEELKDILDLHGKWFRGEEGGARADLSSADLRYADLSSANLRYADLRSANLRYADLSSADLRYADLRSANLRSADLSSADLSYADLSSANLRYANLVTFQFQKHTAYYTLDGALRIGCVFMPISEWILGFEEIGESHGYTKQQIKAYGKFIKQCAEMMGDL